MALQEGKPIWNETLLTLHEWKENMKKYPETCHLKEPPQFFKSEYEWRWRMGAGLSSEEIRLIGERLDDWRKKVKELEAA
jgi:hypothetical protein